MSESSFYGVAAPPPGCREPSLGLGHSASIPNSEYAHYGTAGVCLLFGGCGGGLPYSRDGVLSGCGAEHAHIVSYFCGLHHRLYADRFCHCLAFRSTPLSFCIVLNGAGAFGRALQVVEFQRGNGV